MQRLSGDIAVLGLGVTGEAVARFLLERASAGDDLRVTIYDERDSEREHAVATQLRQAGARVVLGTDQLDADFELCIASPGIPPHSRLMESARERTDTIVSEIEFAFERSHSPWLAITGTNGKTTVTSLCAHILRFAGMPAECVGNIGDPAIQVAEVAGRSTVIVAEVSSFQLALTKRFRPRVAVLLNITPDHLDWHGSLESYSADKARVFANLGAGDTAVIDVDDPGSAPYADTVEKLGVSVVRVSRTTVPVAGAGFEDGELILDVHGSRERLLAVDALQIRGAHNVSNALAAAAATRALGVPAAVIAEALADFVPIAHRLESVGVIDGVEYVNDSKATNPGATLMALGAFGERPIILLAGGRNKGNDFGELVPGTRTCRQIIAFGEAAEEIAAAFEDSDVPVTTLGSMLDALEQARALAEPGDVVLLAPACASFDEFSGYAERGRIFTHAVESYDEVRA